MDNSDLLAAAKSKYQNSPEYQSIQHADPKFQQRLSELNVPATARRMNISPYQVEAQQRQANEGPPVDPRVQVAQITSGSRENVAQTNAQSRTGVAETAAGAHTTAAQAAGRMPAKRRRKPLPEQRPRRLGSTPGPAPMPPRRQRERLRRPPGSMPRPAGIPAPTASKPRQRRPTVPPSRPNPRQSHSTPLRRARPRRRHNHRPRPQPPHRLRRRPRQRPIRPLAPPSKPPTAR